MDIHLTDISESHFDDVVQLLDADDLYNLFQALGIKKRDVEKAEANAGTTDINIRGRNVLMTWRNRLGKLATRICILDALKECANIEAWELLDSIWNQRGSVESYLSPLKHCTWTHVQ